MRSTSILGILLMTEMMGLTTVLGKNQVVEEPSLQGQVRE